ncbi:LysM repeat protein [Arthrobacter sp. 1088]|uniref:LysM peptidoglycan-binding domain-containing protein n=1 Tax=Arthrobacter sp. 1088 TaxID=2817768 RepID=UPI0028647192|nr:LysM peptidoglycan-binding domain-containing protein [Arthrobacter sp. 1088]MDR6688252.1 LysM repeat protein [Arthrobacter sp. 1088]
MSKKSTTARHRATPGHSIVLEGLSVTARTQARALGRPALVAVAASGLVFSMGAPAHAGVHGPEIPGSNGALQAQASAPSVLSASDSGRVYTVVSGDTLGRIAAAYGVSLDGVLAANGLSISSIIFPGDQLRIPATGSTAAPARASVTATTSGGTLLVSASTPVASSSIGSALLASAYSQLGVQQDCTAMVEKALRSVGKSVGDLAPTQFFQYGTVVGTPAPGDLVITPGHVGIYAGNGQVVSGGVNGYQTAVHSISWLPGASFVRVA